MTIEQIKDHLIPEGFFSFARAADFYGQHATLITTIFCIFILVYSLKKLKAGGEQAQIVPAIAVSLGVFFTFLGLAFSLVATSHSGIQGQFDALLGGLSTAFWTSVMGLGVSIYSKSYLAKRADHSPIRDIEDELKHVRGEIARMGEDITDKLTKSLVKAVDDYSQAIAASLNNSSHKIADLNYSYTQSLENLNTGLDGIHDKMISTVNAVSEVSIATQKLCSETREVLDASNGIMAQQADWTNEIQKSMSSVAELAPEAKSVFESIDKLNASQAEYSMTIENIFEDNKARFSTDLDKITENIVMRIANIDSEHEKRVLSHLENLDAAVNESFKIILNNYGEGFVELAKKKLSIMTEIIEQLEHAKEAYMEHRHNSSTNNTNAYVPSENATLAQEGA